MLMVDPRQMMSWCVEIIKADVSIVEVQCILQISNITIYAQGMHRVCTVNAQGVHNCGTVATQILHCFYTVSAHLL